jgi:hypothetical protein
MSPIYIIWEILQNLSNGFSCTIPKTITCLIFPPHQHGYEKEKLTCAFFMSMIFILIQIKFDIDINNDELLETIHGNIRRETN